MISIISDLFDYSVSFGKSLNYSILYMILDYQRLTNYDNLCCMMTTAVSTIHNDIQM